MNYRELIGKRVINQATKKKGKIIDIVNNKILVFDGFDTVKYSFPDAFSDILLLEDTALQEELQEISNDASFSQFKSLYSKAIQKEIDYLKIHGDRRYRIVDGVRISKDRTTYIYSFDTDSEFRFPDGTGIKLWFPDKIVSAYVISCEEFSIVFQTTVDLGDEIDSLEFTSEPWGLIEPLLDRLEELNPVNARLSYELVNKRRSMIDRQGTVIMGQDNALRKAVSPGITIIWGPPGTGKTTTLAKIALEYILHGKRVLMLSYSNVSVDGALIRVAGMSDAQEGRIVRYGYPRMTELLESDHLTTYGYVLKKKPEIAKEYYALLEKRRKLKKNNPEKIGLKKRIQIIRKKLVNEEIELVHTASFVATTVSKAVIDKAIYSQKFDLVLFDEASMSYVPQVVFAASLAKESFCCLGDFRQLPAIVQNSDDSILHKDIFDYTNIVSSVENGYGHKWLVMLNKQYRMHPEISDFASKHMYQNLLLTADLVYEHRKPIAALKPFPQKPIGMIDLSGSYSVCVKTMDGSRINLLSAMMSIFIADMFAGRYDVGIITPYSAQSRLILAMIRDLKEKDHKYEKLMSATVHQFQGSEQPVIVYDAVDCFRMSYPGVLLTSKKHDTANRLFNVALTRSQGKFILIANHEYFERKNISRDLMFTQLMDQLISKKQIMKDEMLLEQIATEEDEKTNIFFGDRDEEDSWNRFLEDISHAEREIYMDIPGPIDDDDEAIKQLLGELRSADHAKTKVYMRVQKGVSLPESFSKYIHEDAYVTTPFTIIDKRVIWFGEPLAAADFISEGKTIDTTFFPCMRFEGKITSRMLRAIYNILNL